MAIGFNSDGLVGLLINSGSETPLIGTYKIFSDGLAGSYISAYFIKTSSEYPKPCITVGTSPSSVAHGLYYGCFSYRYA